MYPCSIVLVLCQTASTSIIIVNFPNFLCYCSFTKSDSLAFPVLTLYIFHYLFDLTPSYSYLRLLRFHYFFSMVNFIPILHFDSP